MVKAQPLQRHPEGNATRRVRKRLEEQAAAERKEMEENKIELIQFFMEMKQSELMILKQQAEIRSLCAEIEKLEMESSEDSQEELQYSHLKAWVQKIFDRVTAGPHQKSFSKFKDPIKQMEVVRDFIRRVRANSSKAETNPQQDKEPDVPRKTNY